MFALLSAIALAGVASAQSTASAYDINLIKANFQNAQLTPQLIPDFSPQGTLSVSYGGQALTIGQNISQSAVASSPVLSVAAASGSTRINTNSLYTVALIDANPVGTDQNTTPQTRHWLVNTVGLTGSGPYTLNYTGATTITDYADPGPFSGSGSHRYVALVYAQGSNFAPPANLSTAGIPLGTIFLQQYVNSTGLGPLVAANYFQVENGVATISVVPTSAVNTATIASSTSASAVASSGGSSIGSAVSGGSSSTSVSGPAVGASTAASTSRSATGEVKSLNWGVGLIIGAVGVMGTLLGASLGF